MKREKELNDSIRISRSMKKAETMVLDIEKSSSPEEEQAATAAAGVDCPEEVVVGTLSQAEERPTPGKVQCPTAVSPR